MIEQSWVACLRLRRSSEGPVLSMNRARFFRYSALMKLGHKLKYPVFLKESDQPHKFAGYSVSKSHFGFTVFERVPNSASDLHPLGCAEC